MSSTTAAVDVSSLIEAAKEMKKKGERERERKTSISVHT